MGGFKTPSESAQEFDIIITIILSDPVLLSCSEIYAENIIALRHLNNAGKLKMES